MNNNKKSLALLLATLTIAGLGPAAALAAPTDKDVNVVNTPDVVIANQDPIPVTVENSGAGGTDYVSVSAFEQVNAPTSRVIAEVFSVPPGKIFIAEYISIYLDVVVRNRPQSGLRIAARLDGSGTNGISRFELGYMEEFVFTSRGTPNFIMARELTAYFTEGPVSCVSDTHFAGSDLDFGIARCNLSGRLIDAP